MFIGFQDDTPASVLFQATEQLKAEVYYNWEEEELRFKKDVYDRSCDILLQMATPDSLIRLQKTTLSEQKQLLKTYFTDQCHNSLVEFLDNQILFSKDNGLVMQVSMHGLCYILFMMCNVFTSSISISLCVVHYHSIHSLVKPYVYDLKMNLQKEFFSAIHVHIVDILNVLM